MNKKRVLPLPDSSDYTKKSSDDLEKDSRHSSRIESSEQVWLYLPILHKSENTIEKMS